MGATSQNKHLFTDYEGFTEKFKTKLTTDDCYTPPAVFETVRDYVDEQVMPLKGVEVVRPFWPGGDYETFDYPEGAVVIDNPPFSILSKIRRFFHARGIKYFLFAPHLTLFNSGKDLLESTTFIVAAAPIVFENGADINVSFVTNMLNGHPRVRVAGDLNARLAFARKSGTRQKKLNLPPCVISSARLGAIASQGISLDFESFETIPVSKLDNYGGIYGGGFFLSQAATRRHQEARARAEEARAEIVTLSEREQKLIDEALHPFRLTPIRVSYLPMPALRKKKGNSLK
ncbi:MAG: chromosome partitioning protein ParB [Muribaculaceae bacterium]|nr:chromosome partitioning protein ParB [Muribaculaceae bacterium]